MARPGARGAGDRRVDAERRLAARGSPARRGRTRGSMPTSRSAGMHGLVGELEALVVRAPISRGVPSTADARALPFRAVRPTRSPPTGPHEPRSWRSSASSRGQNCASSRPAMLRHDPSSLAPPAGHACGGARARGAAVARRDGRRRRGSRRVRPRGSVCFGGRVVSASGSRARVARANRPGDELRRGRDGGRAGSRSARGRCRRVWVVNRRDRTVTRVSPRRRVETIGGVPFADHVAVDGDDVWVSSLDRASIARIDGQLRRGRRVHRAPVASTRKDWRSEVAPSGLRTPRRTRGVGTETVSRIDLRTRRSCRRSPSGRRRSSPPSATARCGSRTTTPTPISVVSPGVGECRHDRRLRRPARDRHGLPVGVGRVLLVERARPDRSSARSRSSRASRLGPGPLDVSIGAGCRLGDQSRQP